ncbi:unnamed protein product [Echinostoma caproni]|uniref:Chromosome_seg domain-containing protein n=1 Tax=Echinostoma caproni TaxID=27848 RepID=A0A183AAB5_9TREM|nr:unnamed protein product [Echinostoma caproni]
MMLQESFNLKGVQKSIGGSSMHKPVVSRSKSHDERSHMNVPSTTNYFSKCKSQSTCVRPTVRRYSISEAFAYNARRLTTCIRKCVLNSATLLHEDMYGLPWNLRPLYRDGCQHHNKNGRSKLDTATPETDQRSRFYKLDKPASEQLYSVYQSMENRFESCSSEQHSKKNRTSKKDSTPKPDYATDKIADGNLHSLNSCISTEQKRRRNGTLDCPDPALLEESGTQMEYNINNKDHGVTLRVIFVPPAGGCSTSSSRIPRQSGLNSPVLCRLSKQSLQGFTDYELVLRRTSYPKDPHVIIFP